MNTHRLKKGFFKIATYRTFGSPKSRHAGESARAGERGDHCIESDMSYVDQIANYTRIAIYNTAISRSQSKNELYEFFFTSLFYSARFKIKG